MDSIVIRVVNRIIYIWGDFSPGTLLESQSGAKLLVVSRRRELLPEYVELLRLAGALEDTRSVATSRALLVGGEPPQPGEVVRPYQWPSGRGIYSPEGEIDLLEHTVTPHISVIGATGAGKTTLVKLLVEHAVKRGLRVVVFDIHGEYSELVQKLGGHAGPPVLPLCDLSDQELLAITGLLRVQSSPIRMMRYLRFFIKAFCTLADKAKVRDLQTALQSSAEAMIMLDNINPSIKTLDGKDSIMVEFANALREAVGGTIYNALREMAKRDEERIAAAMMYLLWAASAAQIALHGGEFPSLYIINMFESKELFMTSDVAVGVLSYVVRRIIEERLETVIVAEEAAKLMADETMSRILFLALAETRKFGAKMIMVSQRPGEYISNTRIIAGRVQNVAWAKELAALAPQMPGEISRLLPQLRRGEFIYIDSDVVPIRVFI
jgi:energy-coupling factor transporter ATP-binding protein EcfA2